VFKGHKGHVQKIEIIKKDNLKCLYSASSDQTIRIWNADNGLTLHVLQGTLLQKGIT
jgi:WD40 repeat protein